jgi:hypothetical protein
VCWREAISLLLILVCVRRFGGIASLTAFARNDEKGKVARNDAIGLFARNDGVGLQARNDEKVACNGNFSQVNKEKKTKEK